MPEFYQRFVGPTLKAKLEEVAAEGDEQRLSLANEVDTSRVLCGEAMRLYDACISAKELKEEQRLKVANVLREALDHVSGLVERMAKVEAMKSDKISVQNVAWFAEKITRIILEEVEPVSADCARRVVRRIADLKTLKDESGVAPRVTISI